MTLEEGHKKEDILRDDISKIESELASLKVDCGKEKDEAEKKNKDEKIQNIEKEIREVKGILDNTSSLDEETYNSLKIRVDSIQNLYKQVKSKMHEILDQRYPTPTTYELLKHSETYERLKQIILLNPKEFSSIPAYGPEAKLEYIFSKIRNWVKLFLKNKIWESEKYNEIIDNTMAPALEWNMLEMLKEQWNNANIGMLNWMNKISWDNFNNLLTWVNEFATSARWSFNKFSQWVNAIDYISIHSEVLQDPTKSQVLTNPIEFKNYLNDGVFASADFSPYLNIHENIFKMDETQNFKFWVSVQDKLDILNKIWNIQVVNNPKTTSLIVKLMDKPEKFFGATKWLQEFSSSMLESVNTINSVTKLFWKDIMWEICKEPEQRDFTYKVLDFVCKLIGITWWLEWIVKKWRLDRMMLSGEKNANIRRIIQEYNSISWGGEKIAIVDSASCLSALSAFESTDLNNQSTTKWDYLRDTISENIDINLISPVVVKETIWEEYIIKWVSADWKSQESVDAWKIINNGKKKELVHIHINNMKKYLETNYNNLVDFYSNINNTDDLAVCIVAWLYANKDDVIEWVKAKVFLPENYLYWLNLNNNSPLTQTTGQTIDNWNNNIDASAPLGLTDKEKEELDTLVQKSKTPNKINYLENETYKKYLHLIEYDLGLPRYFLQSICFQESKWHLYWEKNKILWSWAWAKWLFQFMPWTADLYMKHKKLKEKYWKTFSSRNEFYKDPLASAWAAWIMCSESIAKWFSIQKTLACYNRWEGNYRNKIWRNVELTQNNFGRLPSETQKYVKNITTNMLTLNWVASRDFLWVDLSQYSRSSQSAHYMA